MPTPDDVEVELVDCSEGRLGFSAGRLVGFARELDDLVGPIQLLRIALEDIDVALLMPAHLCHHLVPEVTLVVCDRFAIDVQPDWHTDASTRHISNPRAECHARVDYVWRIRTDITAGKSGSSPFPPRSLLVPKTGKIRVRPIPHRPQLLEGNKDVLTLNERIPAVIVNEDQPQKVKLVRNIVSARSIGIKAPEFPNRIPVEEASKAG